MTEKNRLDTELEVLISDASSATNKLCHLRRDTCKRWELESRIYKDTFHFKILLILIYLDFHQFISPLNSNLMHL